jgi:hypothetical protein
MNSKKEKLEKLKDIFEEQIKHMLFEDIIVESIQITDELKKLYFETLSNILNAHSEDEIIDIFLNFKNEKEFHLF